MNLLSILKKLVPSPVGTELKKTIIRNREAADALDRAVKEMLKK